MEQLEGDRLESELLEEMQNLVEKFKMKETSEAELRRQLTEMEGHLQVGVGGGWEGGWEKEGSSGRKWEGGKDQIWFQSVPVCHVQKGIGIVLFPGLLHLQSFNKQEV